MEAVVDKPKDMPNLALAFGFAFWYLGFAFREGRLSLLAFRTFILDVIAMLEGKSDNERLANRMAELFKSWAL